MRSGCPGCDTSCDTTAPDKRGARLSLCDDHSACRRVGLCAPATASSKLSLCSAAFRRGCVPMSRPPGWAAAAAAWPMLVWRTKNGCR